MKVSGLFKGGSVHILESEGKFEAIRELIGKALPFAKVKRKKELVEAVIEREQIQSTACGHGIAFAHGKTNEVKNVVAVVGISRKGIRFDSPDGRPVHLLFLLASTPESQLDYLMILSSLARICYDEDLVREVTELVPPAEVENKLMERLEEELLHTRMRMRR